VSRPVLWSIGLITACLLWTACLFTEYRYFPDGAVRTVIYSINRVLPSARRERIDVEVRDYVHSTLKTDYPPGGFVGYVRWAVHNGTMNLPRVIDGSTIPYRLNQHRTGWLIRVGISFLFTAGAILSQVLGLAPPPQSEAEPEAGRAEAVAPPT
jgi:hypothetical protein